MASSSSDSPSEPPMIEQVVTEFFAKSLHIILESRSPYVSSRNYCVDPFLSSPSSSSSSSSSKPRDKWFNLALKECPAALENFDLWRQSNVDPLVVDVILTKKPSAPDLNPLSPGRCLIRNLSGNGSALGEEAKYEKIVERWIIQYETQNSGYSSNNSLREVYSGSRKHSGSTSQSSETSLYMKTYKKSIILFRSLYILVRLLPAYKLFGELNSSGRICPWRLSHRISYFVEPFTRADDVEMNNFSFAPIDTPCGRLSLSVSYLPTVEDVSSEPSTPMSTQFIMDYVGSPTASPLKRFHSLPTAGMHGRVPASRRNSWSNENGATPLLSPSPSPKFCDSHATPHNSIQVPFPFPPVCPVGGSLLRSESAPSTGPFTKARYKTGSSQALPPCPTRLGFSPQNDKDRPKLSTAPPTSAPSFRSDKVQISKESVKLEKMQSGINLIKTPSFGKDEAYNLFRYSSSSPSIPLPGSYSRYPLLDNFDDSEFHCPFADAEDVGESHYRIELPKENHQLDEGSEARDFAPVTRSPNAVVGELVWMLKTAVPLRTDSSSSVTDSQSLGYEISKLKIQQVETGVVQCDDAPDKCAIAELFKSRTAADALEELRMYKEMKETILRQGGSRSISDPL